METRECPSVIYCRVVHMRQDYVHGYSQRESTRLFDQASTLTDLLHADTRYPAGSSVLEAGWGVGAQTVPLARNSPGALFTTIDVSAGSLEEARERASAASIGALPAPRRLWSPGGLRLAEDGLGGFQPAPVGRGVHEKHLYGDGGGSPGGLARRGARRSRDLAASDRRAAADCGEGRSVLLHVLQGGRGEVIAK